jgi:hypothetical protein
MLFQGADEVRRRRFFYFDVPRKLTMELFLRRRRALKTVPPQFSGPAPAPLGPTELVPTAGPSGQQTMAFSCGQFRTIQVYPKDLAILVWQVERAGDPPSNREGHAMDERTIDRTQSWISDTQAMALYSTLLFLVMVLWVYVPA